MQGIRNIVAVMLLMVAGIQSARADDQWDHFLFLTGSYHVTTSIANVSIDIPTGVPKRVHDPIWVPYAAEKSEWAFLRDSTSAWVSASVAGAYNADSAYSLCYEFEASPDGLYWIPLRGMVGGAGAAIYHDDCADQPGMRSHFSASPRGSGALKRCPKGEAPLENKRDTVCAPAKCACNENKSPEDGSCTLIEPDTEIDWQAGLVYEYPDNNHNDAPRCDPIPIDEYDGCESGARSSEVGNPIDCATGRKVQREMDYLGSGHDPLVYERIYRSPKPEGHDGQEEMPFPDWIPGSIPQLESQSFADGATLNYLVIGDWYRRAFFRKSNSGNWQTNPGMPYFRIDVENAEGQSFTTRHGDTHQFTLSGILIQSKKNKKSQYFYEYTDFPEVGRKLTKISNRFGDFIEFKYDGPDSKLSLLEDQGGVKIYYHYDEIGNLAEVVFPDESSGSLEDNPRKKYLYENVEFPHHLTGVVDENGSRFATFSYDNNGRAVLSEHALGAERVEVSYPADGEAVVRFYQHGQSALYREEHYTYGQFRGAYRLTSKAVMQCPGCEPYSESWEYNENGLRVRHTSPRGDVTEWHYDDKGRRELQVEAVGTANERVSRYEWSDEHDQLKTLEFGNEKITYQYNEQGMLVEEIREVAQ